MSPAPRKRILFVHQNFPGQFLHLAPALQARGHEVLALTSDSHRHPSVVPMAHYKWQPREFDKTTFRLSAKFAEMTWRGEIAAAAATTLRDKHGFMPDVVFGTPGWGETLFLGEVWPEAKRLLYAEFFYGPRGPMVGFDREFENRDLAANMTLTANQAHLLVSVNDAHKLLCPTHWQAKSFPEFAQPRISVIHDGIATDDIRPSENAVVRFPEQGLTFRKGDELLTFVNRNHEPARGFHIFMRALPSILKARPQAHVVIVGGDERSYSPLPAVGVTWREVLMREVGAQLDMSRVHFVGKIPYQSFVQLMQVSRVHAYLTYPFVLSWSLLEAMSAGALVVASRTPPAEEVIFDGQNGRLVDFFDVGAWSAMLIETLANHQAYTGLRDAARRTVVEGYDLKSKCLPRLVDFVESA
jgi:glycosyltransferase involved in cell wall biosynthesis